MKKTIFLLAMGMGFGLSNTATAADGTITITGNVTGNTCTITASPAGTTVNGMYNFTVNLPKDVSTTALSSANQTAGNTKFQISLANCSTAINNAQVYFENGPTVDQTSGNLLNTTGTGNATNVQVRLLNNAFNPINIASNNTNNSAQAVSGTGTARGATFTYFAQYIATGVATAGTVNTSVTYTMIYS